LRSVQERWEALGMVPRDSRDRLEARLRKVEETIRGAEESEWRRSNPEARARAEATVNQLRTSIEQIEKRLAKAQAASRAKEDKDPEARARAEATVNQLRTSIEQIEKRLAKAQAAGRDKDVKDAEEALTARQA